MTGFQSKRAVAQSDLIDRVLDQIAQDLEGGDLTAIEELLKFVPRENLLAYLSENTVIDINNTGGKW
jgi:hypothetical protein